MAPIVAMIRESARSYEGYCTFAFAQDEGTFNYLINKDEATSRGVCQALTNRWIAGHANDQSMWIDLYPTVDGRTRLNPAVAKEIMLEQKAGGGGMTQLVNNEKWLEGRGLIPFEHPTLRTYTAGGCHAKVIHAAFAVAHAVSQSRSSDGHYLSVALLRGGNKAGGHGVAIHIGGDRMHRASSGLTYFDPNIGEFWFKDKTHFARWFIRTWQTLGEQKQYIYRAFYISSFAKKHTPFAKQHIQAVHCD